MQDFPKYKKMAQIVGQTSIPISETFREREILDFYDFSLPGLKLISAPPNIISFQRRAYPMCIRGFRTSDECVFVRTPP